MFSGSESLDQFRDSVVAATTVALNNWYSNHGEAGHALHWGNYFIKFGNPSLLYEAETQAYLYEKAIRDPLAPVIPKVITFFTRGHVAYMVSEFIDAPTIETWLQHSDPSQHADGYRAVANALDWLRHVPAPTGVLIGQVGGGPARHSFFPDFEAPLRFASIDAVERFVNKACEYIPSKFMPPPVSFSTEKSVFIQADPAMSNFLMDAGRIVLIDFEDVSLLPESFSSYTMQGSGNCFVEVVAQYLPWEKSQNLSTMGAAQYVLHLHAQPTLGLNEHGYPTHKSKRDR